MVGLIAAVALAAAPAPVTKMVTVSRLSVPRWVVASGQGFGFSQRMPFGYVARDSVPGRGTSLYLAINRDHYERDWYTADGRHIHWQSRAYRHGRPGRLFHDIAFGPTYLEWRAGGRIHRRHETLGPDETPDPPLTPLDAFAAARSAGGARRAGFVRLRGRRVARYVQGTIVWLADARSGRLLEQRVTEHGTRDGRRYTARQRVRIVAVRHAARAKLRLARDG